MTHKWFIVLLGILVGSQVPSAGQIPTPQIVLAQKPVAPVIAAFRAESTPSLAPSLLLSKDFKNSVAHSSFLVPGPYEREDGLERLSPVKKVKTLIFTRSSLPLVQFWSGKVQLDAFQTTLRIQNVQFGTLGGAVPDFRLAQQDFPGGSRSVHLSGLNLTFHFGRVGRTRGPMQIWNCVPRIAAALLY